jgi:hypothetical protein
MLVPHGRANAKLSHGGNAAQKLQEPIIFIWFKPVAGYDFGRNGGFAGGMYHHACRLTKPPKIHKSYSCGVDLDLRFGSSLEFCSHRDFELNAIASRRNNASRSMSFAFSRKGFPRIMFVLSLLPPGIDV